MHSSAAVANVFLELAKAEGRTLTNMQVQKLVYFAHGVHLAGFDEPLIHEHAKAWTFGPVIPELYESLRKYGAEEVKEPLAAPDHIAPGTDARRAIDATWKAYGTYTAAQMVRVSHIKGGPWDLVWNAPDGNGKFGVISDAVIKDYYRSRVKKADAQAA